MRLRNHAAEHGVSFDNLKIDFARIIGRSRTIANKLQKGIGSLFSKYNVKHELATGQLLAPHRVRVNGKDGAKEVTAAHVILAVGSLATQLPGATFDGKLIIGLRES